MTISKELFLAILAVDAYNQNYNPSIGHGKTNIGSAKVGLDSEDIFADTDSDPNNPLPSPKHQVCQLPTPPNQTTPNRQP